MAGRRLNLATLAGQTVETTPGSSKPTLVHLPPDQVAATPLNPRQDFDPTGLEELGNSMRTGQLQPCVAITRVAYIKLFPEHTDQLLDCRLVMAAGERRWKAALKVGLPTIDVHIREDLAESRTRFLAAVLTENVERANFNPIEEARGLQRMLEMTGGQQTEAAAQLGKSKQWFNQRIGLLRLTDDMQQLVVTGKLTAFRDMRRYSALPAAEQMPAWKADQMAAEQRALEPNRPRAERREEPGYTAVYPQPPEARREPVTSVAPSAAEAAPPAPPVAEPPSRATPAGGEQRQPVPSVVFTEPQQEMPTTPPSAAVPVQRPEQEQNRPSAPDGPTKMPWTDGPASMDIAYEQWTGHLQRRPALARYLELLGSPDKFAADLVAASDPDYRRALIKHLSDSL